MRFSTTISVATLTAAATAAPIAPLFANIYSFSPALAEFYARVSSYIGDISSPIAPTCDTSNIQLPADATAPGGLPAVPAGQVLKYVAIGLGSQNYTCADSTANSTPTQVGALATLFDVTCIAASFPDLLVPATAAVLNFALPPESTPLAPVNALLLGHHFFPNSTTPEFNLDTTTDRQFGIALAKKAGSMNAPAQTIGQVDVSSTPDVAWLFLETIEGTVGNYTSVYRVNTNGGSPPSTCEGMKGSFQVPYSADYFFYVSA